MRRCCGAAVATHFSGDSETCKKRLSRNTYCDGCRNSRSRYHPTFGHNARFCLTLSDAARIVQDIHCERLRPAGDIRAGRFHFRLSFRSFIDAFHPLHFMTRSIVFRRAIFSIPLPERAARATNLPSRLTESVRAARIAYRNSRRESMPFKKGNRATRSGRPKENHEVRQLARAHSEDAIKRLVFWMRSNNPKASITASVAILNRAWGIRRINLANRRRKAGTRHSRGAMERIERRRHLIEYCARKPFVAFHRRRQRWAVLLAHRRAGKTVATINDKIRRALKSEVAAWPVCLCRAVPGAGQGSRLGISQAVRRIVGPPQERKRALGRAGQRRAHPYPRRRQSGPAARALSRRRRARRIRRHAPVGLGRGDPPDARRPAGLGDLYRHAEGPQRILPRLAAGAGRSDTGSR